MNCHRNTSNTSVKSTRAARCAQSNTGVLVVPYTVISHVHVCVLDFKLY